MENLILSNLFYPFLAFGVFLMVRSFRRHRAGSRELVEDALKLLISSEGGDVSALEEALSRRLKLSDRARDRLIRRMADRGLVRSGGRGIELTSEGKVLGLQIVRAHRLLERYLVDEADVSLKEVHRFAEKREHRLTGEEVDSLEARLGYPDRDPHGDPIPGRVVADRAESGTPLTDWPVGVSASIRHIEDEPASIFAQILAEGLLPGTELVVKESSDRGIRLGVDGGELWLAQALAANIFVSTPRPGREAIEGEIPLSRLEIGKRGVVTEISEEIRGLARRRLLDLGFTRGAVVTPWLRSSFGGGDPVAYRLRGTTIALRREQTDRIRVKAVGGEG